MSNFRLSRRSFTATGAALATGLFATRAFGVSARQGATPSAGPESLGYVSMRLRTIADSASREQVDELVDEQFAPDVQQLEGYGGYLNANVIGNDAQSLTVVLVEEPSQAEGFDALAADFVSSLGETGEVVETEQWAGNMLMSAAPAGSAATPTVEDSPILREGYVAVRIHTSLPGTDPRDFVPLAADDFVPRMEALEGFEGYLWFPIEDGFVAISLFDSEASAEASNDEAVEWAAEFLEEYTDGNPRIINGNIQWAQFPLLAEL